MDVNIRNLSMNIEILDERFDDAKNELAKQVRGSSHSGSSLSVSFVFEGVDLNDMLDLQGKIESEFLSTNSHVSEIKKNGVSIWTLFAEIKEVPNRCELPEILIAYLDYLSLQYINDISLVDYHFHPANREMILLPSPEFQTVDRFLTRSEGLYDKRHYFKTIECLIRARESNPKSEEIHLLLVQLLLEIGLISLPLKMIEEDIKPGFYCEYFLYQKAYICERLGKGNEAFQFLKILAESLGDSHAAIISVSDYLRNAGFVELSNDVLIHGLHIFAQNRIKGNADDAPVLKKIEMMLA